MDTAKIDPAAHLGRLIELPPQWMEKRNKCAALPWWRLFFKKI